MQTAAVRAGDKDSCDSRVSLHIHIDQYRVEQSEYRPLITAVMLSDQRNIYFFLLTARNPD